MNDRLKLGHIFALVSRLKEEGMEMKDILELPVYIGDDDELNGIHNAFTIQKISPENPSDSYYFELIDERTANISAENQSILIC